MDNSQTPNTSSESAQQATNLQEASIMTTESTAQANTENFWDIKDNDKVSFDRPGLIRFLEKRGFAKIGYDKANYEVVYIKNNIAERASLEAMIDEVRNYLEATAEPVVVDAFLEEGTKLINQILSKSLITRQPDFQCDTAESCYLFYRNTAVRVTKDLIELVPYGDLEGILWRRQIKDRDFVQTSSVDSEYAQFCKNVAGPTNYEALQTNIGYMIHRYKDPSRAKAIILMDGALQQTGHANGGTGKSLVVHGIRQIRNAAMEDGKTGITKGNRFAFQLVRPDTEVLIIDDIRKDFEMETLYAAITGDFIVEAKYEKRFAFPFGEGPKVILTSNYMVSTRGYSDERRRIIFPVTDHYGEHRKPLDDFGHRLFTDWEGADWQKFDAFMCECVQRYLASGLLQPEMPNYKELLLCQDTSYQFPEWADTNLQVGKSYDRGELRKDYLEVYPDQAVTPQQFGAWIRKWSIARKCPVKFRDSNSRRMVDIRQAA